MSNEGSRYNTEDLLIEYMYLVRQQTTRQSNIIQTFIDTQQRNVDNTRSLLQRYLETQIRAPGGQIHTNSRPFNTTPFDTRQPNTRQFDTRQYNTRQPNTRQPNTRQYNTTPFNITQFNTTQSNTRPFNTTQFNTTPFNTTQFNTTQSNTRPFNTTQFSTRQSTRTPYVSRGTSRLNSVLSTRPQPPRPIYNFATNNFATNNFATNNLRGQTGYRGGVVPINRRRNILTQILENSLYTSSNIRPASTADISRNVITYLWSDIMDTTDQTFDTITQEHFQPSDRVSRIERCGHLFMEDALSTYFTQFDHRCPVCRYDIRTSILPSTTQLFDISFTFLDLSSNLTPNFGVRNLTRQNNFDISWNNADFNTDFNSAVNELSNAMMSSLSTIMTNPDNSGNSMIAEYSLFIPVTTNTTNTDDTGYDDTTNTDDTGYDDTTNTDDTGYDDTTNTDDTGYDDTEHGI